MRNGVAQARYEIQNAIASPALQGEGNNEAPRASVGRLERAEVVLGAWQNAYGTETRRIDDDSLYPVLEEMKSEANLLSAAKNFASITSSSWFGILFGAGGTGTLLASLLLKLLQERSRRRDMENAASDCADAIENIGDETTRREVKESVRKRQASRTEFHKLVQKTSPG